MRNTGGDKYEKTAREIRNDQISAFLQQLQDDLQKSDSCGQVSEQKKVLTSANDSLACVLINLGAFCPIVAHLPSAKLILQYFSSPRGVAISVPFPEVRNRKGTESGLHLFGFFDDLIYDFSMILFGFPDKIV